MRVYVIQFVSKRDFGENAVGRAIIRTYSSPNILGRCVIRRRIRTRLKSIGNDVGKAACLLYCIACCTKRLANTNEKSGLTVYTFKSWDISCNH